MENKTYQFKKVEEIDFEKLERGLYLTENVDGYKILFNWNGEEFWSADSMAENIVSVLLPLSKVGEVSDEQIDDLLWEFHREAKKAFVPHKGEAFSKKYIWRFRSLLQPQPVNAEGNHWTKDCECKEEDRIGESWCCNNCGRMLSVSSEGKKEEKYRDGAPEHNPQNPHLGYKTAIFEPTVEQGEAKEPTDLDETALRQKFLNWCLEHYTADKTITVEDYFQWFLPHLAFRSSEVKEQEIESDFKKDVESVCNKIVTMDITNTGDYRSGGECPFCRKDCRFDANDVSEIEHEMNCVYLIAKDLLSAPSK